MTLDRADLRAGQPDVEEFVKFLQGEAAVEQVFTLSDLAGFGLDRMELVLEVADQLGQQAKGPRHVGDVQSRIGGVRDQRIRRHGAIGDADPRRRDPAEHEQVGGEPDQQAALDDADHRRTVSRGKLDRDGHTAASPLGSGFGYASMSIDDIRVERRGDRHVVRYRLRHGSDRARPPNAQRARRRRPPRSSLTRTAPVPGPGG